MSERVKLSEPGESLTMTVRTVGVEQIDNTDYSSFEDGAKELLVPSASVKRQLDRLKVAEIADLAGKTIKFSRSTGLSKYGKPYWNLDLAEAPNGKPPVAKKVPAPAYSNKAEADLPPLLRDSDKEDAAELAAKLKTYDEPKPKMRDAYRALTEWVLAEIVPLYDKADLGMAAGDAAACVQTLFIQASNRGKIE